MKYIVLLCDGMADRAVPVLDGKTPMQVAHKPNMDRICAMGEMGLVQTVPAGMNPGSDTANLSVMGYAPEIYYTGRSPLEAVSMGIDLALTDRTFRCNTVTLSDEEDYENKTMLDYSAGEITTAESSELIRFVQEKLGDEIMTFYPGVSYRHCLVWKEAPNGFVFTPPHDISDKKITEYLPSGRYGAKMLDLMKKSYELLKDHPVNQARIARGLRPANSIWLWGDGTKPALKPFKEEYGLDGAVISAVDLIKGIGLCADMQSIDVEGATGLINTNWDGKTAAAIQALKTGKDFVYLHMEAPDECGHHGDAKEKVESIEIIDQKVLGPILEAFKDEELSVMILPDHPTPIDCRTHVGDPVPYLIYRNTVSEGCGKVFTEETAATTGCRFDNGPSLMKHFLGK